MYSDGYTNKSEVKRASFTAKEDEDSFVGAKLAIYNIKKQRNNRVMPSINYPDNSL